MTHPITTPAAPRRRRGRLALAAGLAAWAVVTAVAFGHFWRLDATPGLPAASPPPARPERAERLSVLVFLHPDCPCGRATLAELRRALAEARRPAAVRVLLVVPDAADRSWRESPLHDLAARLPSVSVEPDPRGATARVYGARTSGQVFVYRGDGSLAFEGGVTGSRGHEGDNAGRTRFLAAVNGDDRTPAAPPPPPTRAPVYGCRLPEFADPSPFEVKP